MTTTGVAIATQEACRGDNRGRGQGDKSTVTERDKGHKPSLGFTDTTGKHFRMMADGRDPPFQSMIRASGLAEVWTHTHDGLKFGQFGWRCTNKEDSYSNPTLIGNWNEERFDIERQKTAKRLPSQYEHYFDTTNAASYNIQPTEVPKELKHLKARHPHAHPGHQPELDSPSLKSDYNSFQTTTRAAYIDPRVRKTPLAPPPGTSSN